MSASLGTIDYPQAQDEEQPANPLDKYHRQLDPLAKMTDQLWRPVRQAQTAPINPYMGQMLTDMGARGMTPAVGTPPQGPLPPPEAAPPSAQLAAAAPQAAPGATPAGTLAEQGGPTDVTQYQQDPDTGAITRGPMARRLAAMGAGDVPTFGSQALQQAGQAPAEAGGAAPEAEPGIPPPEEAPEQSESHSRISTRIPSEAEQRKTGINAHETSGLEIDHDSMKRAPEALAKNAKLIKERYPGFAHLRTDDPDKITEAFINHAKDNLKWIFNKMSDEKGPIGPSIVERAKRWYSGANKIAHSLAKEFNVKPYQAAAVLAALSPQKDWYQNVHLARKVFEAHKLGHNWTMTPEMQAYSDKYLAQLEKPTKRKDGTIKQPDMEEIGNLRKLQEKFRTTPMARLTDPHERAVFARWHDEAHNPRDYKMVTPEGEMAGTSMVPAKYYTSGKRKGELKEAARPRNVSWGSFNEIAKGMAALQNASLPEVSRLMGGNHKVRNFFNNIIAPLHGKDVTIDTHAIAAALLRPLGGGHEAVGHGLGTSAGKGVPGAANSGTLGNRGMYGLYAEAYRRAAKDLGISPRELQSVTWEGIRGLFSPEQKRNSNFVAHVDNIWRNKGEFRRLTPDERREAIATHAGGFKLPSWAGGQDYGDDEE